MEEEVRKRHLARCYADTEDLVEDAFNHLYDKTRAALLDDFRIYAHIHKRRALSLSDVKEFTYWLHKRRLNIWDPARVASDTRKALEQLERMRLANVKRQAALRIYKAQLAQQPPKKRRRRTKAPAVRR